MVTLQYSTFCPVPRWSSFEGFHCTLFCLTQNVDKTLLGSDLFDILVDGGCFYVHCFSFTVIDTVLHAV